MKPLKTYRRIIFMLLIGGFMAGCVQSSGENLKNSASVTDMLGRNVKVPAHIHRVVALNAGCLRLISWLGATNLVCAVEGNEKKRQVPYLFAHPELRNKPIIGTGNNYDAELLTVTAPDVIFSTYITESEADKLQQRTGIPVLAIKYGNFDDEADTVFQTLQFLGSLLGKQQRADTLVDFITGTINDLTTRTSAIAGNDRHTVYVGGIAYRGSHGITSTEPRYPSFRFVNAQNAAASLGAVMTSARDQLINAFIDKEQLIKWDPGCIFIDMAGMATMGEALFSEPWLETLSAFKSGHVYTVFPYNWYTTNYSTILVNSYFIGKFLYPEKFQDVDPEAKADEIYETILGAPVYREMCNHYGKCRKLNID